jgi:hypothetical protein
VALEGRTNKGCVITLDIAFGQRVRRREMSNVKTRPFHAVVSDSFRLLNRSVPLREEC